MRAGQIALVAGVAIFGAKILAWWLTGSAAILADAMESTVNVVSASMLVVVLSIAGRPPDESHPYGHGKAEFLSAAVEGAAITFAAMIIVFESVRELVEGVSIQRLDLGLGLLLAATLANALLGRFLVHEGREGDSLALEADGRHVLADVWTSLGVVVGLVVVRATGWLWADPLIAIAVAVNVAWEGNKLVREALRGLMDEADPDEIARVTAQLEQARRPEWIDLHGLRTWRSGARLHVDLHLTVPRYYDVEQIHEIHDEVEAAILDDDGAPGDVVVHFDPCEPILCRSCAVPQCAIRTEELVAPISFTTEKAVRPDEEIEHGDRLDAVTGR